MLAGKSFLTRDVVDEWLGTGLVISMIPLHNAPGGASCLVLSISFAGVDFAEIRASTVEMAGTSAACLCPPSPVAGQGL
jgi:hypothetical protein